MKTIDTISTELQDRCACFLRELDVAAERLYLLALYTLDEAKRCDRAARVIDAARYRMEAAALNFAATCLSEEMVSATVGALLPGISEEPVTDNVCRVVTWLPVPGDIPQKVFLTASGVLIEQAARLPIPEATALRYAATVLLHEQRADTQALAA